MRSNYEMWKVNVRLLTSLQRVGSNINVIPSPARPLSILCLLPRSLFLIIVSAGVSEGSLGEEGGCNAARKPGPPQVRPGLSEGLEGGGGGARRQRLSLLDDLQEEGVSLERR